MTFAAIEAAIAQGRGIAARVLGHPHAVYRPTSANKPLQGGNILATIPAIMTPQPDAYRAPNLPKAPWWYGEWDTRVTQPGDILVSDLGTWFVWSQQQYSPPVTLQAQRMVDVLLPQNDLQDGLNAYGSTDLATRVPVLVQWPACILLGTKGERGVETLPGDTRLPWWQLYLPATLKVRIPHGAIINDDTGRKFTVSSAELTDGWRLVGQQEAA